MFSKINTKMMKHNRWVFGLLAAVMIVGLVSFLGQGSLFDLFGMGSGSTIGSVYGKRVSVDDLKEHRNKALTLAALRNGTVQRNEMDDKELFDSYAIVEAARRRGIAVSDEEVAVAIKSLPLFQENGRFSHSRYETMLQYYAQLGISGEMISEALRDMLVLTKLQQMLFASVMATDNEVEAFYRVSNISYTYSVATFSADAFRSQVDAKDLAGLKKFYEENKDNYKIPAKLDALVAEFPFANYRDAAEKLADENSLVNFYHKNPALFVVKMAADPNTPLPYDQVKDRVKSEFIKANAKWLAEKDAGKFAQEAYGKVSDAKDKEGAFRKLAETFSLKLESTGQFSVEDKVAGKFESELLIRDLAKAYELAPVSNAISGKDSVLVGFVISREEARHATFNECSALIRNDFVAKNAFDLASKAADQASEEFNTAADKKAFIASLGSRGAKVERFEDRKVSSAGGYEFSLYLAQRLRPGEAGEPVRFENSKLIVFNESAKAPDMSEFEADKGKWRQLCLQDKANKSFEEFQEDLVKNVKINEKYQNADQR